jgi:HAD superfamily hydrolase (TIGR01490 family)
MDPRLRGDDGYLINTVSPVYYAAIVQLLEIILALAIFDLDNTLLSGDSDYLWGVFLGEQGIVDADYYEKENERFYQEYKDGLLDIMEFLQFSLKPLSEHPVRDLNNWREQFIDEKIRPLVSNKSLELVEKHRGQGDTLMIITATNAFVTSPIAELYDIPHLIATDPEMIDDRYTGRVAGEPSFQHGKVKRLDHWLAGNNETLAGSWFYSDSHNDIPLLELVDHPVAVDPDEKLSDHARNNQWPIITLRD